MRRDAPLAKKEAIGPKDLWDKPLILSRQHRAGSALSLWLKREEADLNIVATYSLLYNGSILVDEGLGYAITLDKIINTQGGNLCFRPLIPYPTGWTVRGLEEIPGAHKSIRAVFKHAAKQFGNSRKRSLKSADYKTFSVSSALPFNSISSKARGSRSFRSNIISSDILSIF